MLYKIIPNNSIFYKIINIILNTSTTLFSPRASLNNNILANLNFLKNLSFPDSTLSSTVICPAPSTQLLSTPLSLSHRRLTSPRSHPQPALLLSRAPENDWCLGRHYRLFPSNNYNYNNSVCL